MQVCIVYLCLFLFFLFLWLPWWLPEEEDEAAFWGFKSCSVESTSSVSSWLGSFSWFCRSGEASLSVPLPASPGNHKQLSIGRNPETFNVFARESTYVFRSCDLGSHRAHILPEKQSKWSATMCFIAETLHWIIVVLLLLMWQMTCWRVSLLLWISCSSCLSYCWSSWWNCIQETVSNVSRWWNSNAVGYREEAVWLTSGWWGIDPILWWCCHTSACLQGSCLRMHRSAFPSSPAFPEANGTRHQNGTRHRIWKPNNCFQQTISTTTVFKNHAILQA